MSDYGDDDYGDDDYGDDDYVDDDYADDNYAGEDNVDDDNPDCHSGNESDDVYHAASYVSEASAESADSEEHPSGQSRTDLSLAASRDSLELVRRSFTRGLNNKICRWSV